MQKNLVIPLLLIVSFALWLTGCATPEQRMNRLCVDMCKDEVRDLFGSIFIAKAGKVDNNGNVLDLWEYQDKKTKQTYVIYFLNDRVSQWGKQEDLKGFPELHMPKSRM